MKFQPFFVTYTDTWILGPAASIDTREFRIGLGPIFCEVGCCFVSEKPFRYGCSGCGAIGAAPLDQLPEGWEKRHRKDHTYFFLCPNCQEGEHEEEKDYMITDENRGGAIDEIIGDLMGKEGDLNLSTQEIALRDYAKKLLDESEPFAKSDLAAALAAYLDGLSDGIKL